MKKKFLEFSPLISDICLYHHFSEQLNLPFSELNITPSVRPYLGMFKNFWYWISTFRQSSLVKKTQFELNLTSFKWASPRSAPNGASLGSAGNIGPGLSPSPKVKLGPSNVLNKMLRFWVWVKSKPSKPHGLTWYLCYMHPYSPC